MLPQTVTLLPAPLTSVKITGAFDMKDHDGVDLRAATGTLVYASASGKVVAVGHCLKCRPDAPSIASQGVTDLEDVFHDSLWGYGYGNYVTVRYPAPPAQDGTPPIKRFVYALYAHLSQVLVLVGQEVEHGDVLGVSGETGHTHGPHLHFEVHLSSNSALVFVGGAPVVNPATVFDLRETDTPVPAKGT